ncbi:hypothetical protein HDV00_008392 [Rhizophlyctis rosea]|nr:hypothetical protein HDV00_008392 [Rhizophlyctis rosea]
MTETTGLPPVEPQDPHVNSSGHTGGPPRALSPIIQLSTSNPNVPVPTLPPTEADFLADVSALLNATSLSSADRLATASKLVEARTRWTSRRVEADAIYRKERGALVGNKDATLNTSVGVGQTEIPHKTLGAGANAHSHKTHSLITLPSELFHQILLHLPHPSIQHLSQASRTFRTLLTSHSQSLYKALCSLHFSMPVDDPAKLRARFITDPLSVDWKSIYITRWNLHTGRYRFRMISDHKGLGAREKRHEIVERSQGKWVNVLGRNWLLQCGQPTVAGSGYAVNLRMCGLYLCWITSNTVTVSHLNSPSITHILSGHKGPVISLASNYRDLIVTGSEDSSIRIWYLPENYESPEVGKCVYVRERVDILDVAIWERRVAWYDNENCVGVFDLGEDGGKGKGPGVKGKRRGSREGGGEEKGTGDVEVVDRMKIELRRVEGIDREILNKEVKIAVWDDTVVCGFENYTFLLFSITTGTLTSILSEPIQHRRHEFDSSSYPTVVALFDGLLISRGVRCHELCIWQTHPTPRLLYRLSEPRAIHALSGTPPPETGDVITDFTVEKGGRLILATVEAVEGDVYCLGWEFDECGGLGSMAARGVRGGRGRRFERRSLEEFGSGDGGFEYTGFWLCYE